MNIQPFPSGPLATNAYIIWCKETGESAIIDTPPQSADNIIKYCTHHGLSPKQIIITHSHWDHIGDCAALKERYGAKVSIHPNDKENLEFPGSDGIPMMMPITGVIPDEFLNEGDIVSVGNLKWKVIHTPGHSPGCICLYGNGTLFSGDTIFQGSIGHIGLPTSNPEDMWRSLPKLAVLPADTVVYSGHGPRTTIGRESWLPDARKVFE